MTFTQIKKIPNEMECFGSPMQHKGFNELDLITFIFHLFWVVFTPVADTAISHGAPVSS